MTRWRGPKRRWATTLRRVLDLDGGGGPTARSGAQHIVKTDGFTTARATPCSSPPTDIRGDADTLGYPAVTIPAASLCRLIEHTPDMNGSRWRSLTSMSMPSAPSFAKAVSLTPSEQFAKPDRPAAPR